MHGGDRVAAVLEAQGIQFLFTLCGGHISPILSGAKRRGIRVIDVRDEATAVFAADAVARLTGVPGVAAVTAGPGVTNTITAVKNAQLAQSPVLILGGAAPTVLKGRGALQDIDQMALFKPHVKRAVSVKRVRDLVPVVQNALSLAAEGVPGPVFVECPIDLLYDESLIRGWYANAGGGKSLSAKVLGLYLQHHLGRMFTGAGDVDVPAAPLPTPPQAPETWVTRVATSLAAASKPLLVVGSQTLLQAHRAAEIAAAVEQLGLPVYLSGMARGLLGPGHPLQMRHARRKALKESDCVLLAGVPCDFRLDYGRHIRRGATLASVNRSARDLRQNRKPDIAVLADAGDFLCRLAAQKEFQVRDDWLASLRQRDMERESEIDTKADAATENVNPLRLFRVLDEVMSDDSVIVADGGDFVATAAYTLQPRGPLSWMDPGVFGTLGVGAGFALGAGLLRPGSEIWAIYGDGAFGFSLIEFDSFVRHGIPVIAVVGNDGCWSQIAREQVKMLGDDVGTVLSRTAYHEAAEGLGGVGLLLESEDEIAEGLRQAKQIAATGRPVLVNVMLGSTDFREGSISM
jgi:thiamine pyrophosphate-dependent acetolactate synthase large subunit-like protein